MYVCLYVCICMYVGMFIDCNFTITKHTRNKSTCINFDEKVFLSHKLSGEDGQSFLYVCNTPFLMTNLIAFII